MAYEMSVTEDSGASEYNGENSSGRVTISAK